MTLACHRIVRAVAIASLLVTPVVALAVDWSVQWSTTTPATNAWSTVATTNTAQGFVRLVIGPVAQPSLAVAAGGFITISNATAVVSNGIVSATLHTGSNAWQAAFGQPGVTQLQYRIIIAP
jgi:hypothetical protein